MGVLAAQRRVWGWGASPPGSVSSAGIFERNGHHLVAGQSGPEECDSGWSGEGSPPAPPVNQPHVPIAATDARGGESGAAREQTAGRSRRRQRQGGRGGRGPRKGGGPPDRAG